MASISREILIDAAPAQVWALVADFAEGPVRMAPGLVTGSTDLGEGLREVSFAHGTVVRERLITLDHEARRFVYSVIGGTATPLHDNAVMHVLPHGDNGTRFVWSRDILPEAMAAPFAATMDQALIVIKKTIESD
ncbi:SRPBCC family protein [Nocardia sp. ET3-3]|uniref:SRPBCC family protein n=1 Tax=Nocardia terrae TaxID=2675851 RepID=A0A7K1V1D8_9NOCA|nr:SRPBCC family protein [Nocardia terrae]MVU80463.1 SRPBCC family protein [Nocardia terrae]